MSDCMRNSLTIGKARQTLSEVQMRRNSRQGPWFEEAIAFWRLA